MLNSKKQKKTLGNKQFRNRYEKFFNLLKRMDNEEIEQINSMLEQKLMTKIIRKKLKMKKSMKKKLDFIFESEDAADQSPIKQVPVERPANKKLKKILKNS